MNQRKILVVSDDGTPLSAPIKPTDAELIKQNRKADLYYAYQCGYEAAQGKISIEHLAFQAGCNGEVEIHAEFNQGFADAKRDRKERK